MSPHQRQSPRHLELRDAWGPNIPPPPLNSDRPSASCDTQAEPYGSALGLRTLSQHGNTAHGRGELFSAPPRSLGISEPSRKHGLRMADTQLSHDHAYGMDVLSLDAAGASWPGNFHAINSTGANRRHLLSTERVPDNLVLGKRHGSHSDESVDRIHRPSAGTGNYHPSSWSDHFLRGGAPELWSRGGDDGPVQSMPPQPFYHVTETTHHSRNQFTPASFPDIDPFVNDGSLHAHLAYPALKAPDASRHEGLSHPCSAGHSIEDRRGFHEPSGHRDALGDTVHSDFSAQKHSPDSSGSPDYHTPSPSPLHLQFAQHVRVTTVSPDKVDDGDVSPPSPNRTGAQRKKKSKMHECDICHKRFPRPSGLQTHQNSHTGEKREYPPPPTQSREGCPITYRTQLSRACTRDATGFSLSGPMPSDTSGRME